MEGKDYRGLIRRGKCCQQSEVNESALEKADDHTEPALLSLFSAAILALFKTLAASCGAQSEFRRFLLGSFEKLT